MSKGTALALIVILAVSAFIVIGADSAEAAVTKPSVPEFTLKYVDYSYDTEPDYSTDPYSGKTVMTTPSYHVNSQAVEITIKNQPFSAYTDSEGNRISLYYNYSYKGHYGGEWKTYQVPYYWGYINASQSGDTTITATLESQVSVGDEIDLRVEALVGYVNVITTATPWGPGYIYEFNGESSGWSNIQTITVPSQTSASSPTPTDAALPEPTQQPSMTLNPTGVPIQQSDVTDVLPRLDWSSAAIIALCVAIVALFLVVAVQQRRLGKFARQMNARSQ